MSWFSPRLPEPSNPAALDAILAKSIEAQERAAAAADGVIQAADDNREHVGAAIGALKERSAERLRHRGRGHLSSDVLAVVEATLQQMDERARKGRETPR